jgi:hypothetical protein
VESYHCADDEECVNYACEAIECDCGYPSNHACVDYECCLNSECASDEICDLGTHTCIPVPCECPEKRINHQCDMTPEYCCSDLQCGQNKTCANNKCVERRLSFNVPENLVLGQNITIMVLDQDSNPVNNVGIDVKYLDQDPPVTESYYTDSNGVAIVPIRYAGRVQFVARKENYYFDFQSGEVPEPFNFIFILEIIVLIGCFGGIGIIAMRFLKGGVKIGFLGFRKGPLGLEKVVSGMRVMLRITNRTDKRMEEITIRDSVPRGAFIRCNIMPKIEPYDRSTTLLTWEILQLGPSEEVTIEYETRQANEGFSVKFEGKEYTA